MSEAAITPARPVRILAVGGTIAMSGERAVPALALLSCLGAGLDRDQMASALAPWDAAPA